MVWDCSQHVNSPAVLTQQAPGGEGDETRKGQLQVRERARERERKREGEGGSTSPQSGTKS